MTVRRGASRLLIALGLALATFLGAGVSMARDPAGTPVSVLPLQTDLDPGFRLGPRSSGVLCGPSGSWYWKDVGPEPHRLQVRIEAALAARGMGVAAPIAAAFGESVPLADLRLRGRMTHLAMTGCAPWKPTQKLVGGRKVRGKGRIAIVWELYSHKAQAILWSKEIASDFHYAKATSMTAALEDGLEENVAALIAAWP